MSSSHNKFSNPDSNEPWDLLIGELTAPQGLKGEMRAFPHTDHPERFAKLRRVGLRRGDGPVEIVTVEHARVNGTRIVLKLAGIDSIDAAETYRGVRLYVPPSQAIKLEPDEYFYHQLLGLEVVTTEGEALGKIVEIFPTGANDVYETPLAMIPATKDMIREIDLAHGRMVVDARPGLKKSEPGD